MTQFDSLGLYSQAYSTEMPLNIVSAVLRDIERHM